MLQAGPQILSLPLDSGAEAHAGALGAFLDNGGWIAWGAVPTTGPIGSTPERLWQHLSTEWCDLTRAGCDPVLLREQALITPACGLAGHGEVQADLVLGLPTSSPGASRRRPSACASPSARSTRSIA